MEEKNKLRDQFAGQALILLGSVYNENKTDEALAIKCYQIANAMLEERKKHDPSNQTPTF